MEQQQNKYISALDIGTSKVIALIGEIREDNEIHIVGLGQSPSRGLRAGMVTNIDATAQAIRQAVEDAELRIVAVAVSGFSVDADGPVVADFDIQVGGVQFPVVGE